MNSGFELVVEQPSRHDQYTDDIPVLTADSLAALQANPAHDIATKSVKLSESPSVFYAPSRSHYRLTNKNSEVLIWRRDLPPLVKDFVKAALEVMGTKAASQQEIYITLGQGNNLVRSDGSRITKEHTIRKYTQSGIDQNLASAYTEHFHNSVKSLLLNLPSKLCLSASTIDANFQYYSDATLFFAEHDDGTNNVTFHYSDPGTPYLLKPNLDEYKLRDPGQLYRTKVGDVSMHGRDVIHGFATSAAQQDGTSRPRFYLSYKILPISSPNGL